MDAACSLLNRLVAQLGMSLSGDLSISDISGLTRERMVPSILQKSLQIILSLPGPTRN